MQCNVSTRVASGNIKLQLRQSCMRKFIVFALQMRHLLLIPPPHLKCFATPSFMNSNIFAIIESRHYREMKRCGGSVRYGRKLPNITEFSYAGLAAVHIFTHLAKLKDIQSNRIARLLYYSHYRNSAGKLQFQMSVIQNVDLAQVMCFRGDLNNVSNCAQVYSQMSRDFIDFDYVINVITLCTLTVCQQWSHLCLFLFLLYGISGETSETTHET